MTAGENDSPGVVARPPLIFLEALAAGLVLEVAWPSPALPVPGAVRYPVAALLVIAGFAVAATALRWFRHAGTHADPRKSATALVTDGLFRHTRNPMYLALISVYLGLAIAFGSLWVAGLLIPTLVVLRIGVIAREERYLEAKFGGAYRNYKASVRRWL